MNEKICPGCGKLLSQSRTECPDCQWSFDTGSSSTPYKQVSSARWGDHADTAKKLIKIFVVLALIAGFFGSVYYGLNYLFRSASEASPYPLTPDETARQFFMNLSLDTPQGYQDCYGLLAPQRKAATVIGKQDRISGYFPYFQRIRRYLTRYVGDDFIDTIQVSQDGEEVTFANGIVLNLNMIPVPDLNERPHYALEEIKEFPIDVAPGIGLEAHNRVLNRAIDSMGALTGDGSDDASEIIARKDYETQTERLERLIKGYHYARSLDTKQRVLEWILKEFPTEGATRTFLNSIIEDPQATPILQNIAADHLGRLNIKR